jgi:hypothetical protein
MDANEAQICDPKRPWTFDLSPGITKGGVGRWPVLYVNVCVLSRAGRRSAALRWPPAE